MKTTETLLASRTQPAAENAKLVPSGFHILSQKLLEAESVLTHMGREEGSRRLDLEARSLNSAEFRIGILGESKSGKSTLANAAFLGRDLLFADLMEATCVPTEITFGETPKLSIFPFFNRFEQVGSGDNGMAGMAGMAVRDGEQPAFVINNPGQQEIRAESTADTPAQRTIKAKTISRVRVEQPIESLRGITVVDTPGLNSSTEAVVEASLRIVPACDAVFIVTKGGQLSESESRLLLSFVFDRGISRVMIIINHFQNEMPLNNEGKKQIIANLRNQLASRGREYVPVIMMDAKSWLNAVIAEQTLPEDALAAQQQIRHFLDAELPYAKSERAASILQSELRAASMELAAESQLHDTTAAEVSRIKKQMDDQIKIVKPQFESKGEDFINVVRIAFSNFRGHISAELQKRVDDFVEQLQREPDLSGVQTAIEGSGRKLQPQFEQVFSSAGRQLRTDLRNSSETFEREARLALGTIELRNFLPNTKAGDLLPIPAALVNVMDYILFIMISPLPFFIDIAIRVLLVRIPEVAKLLPTNLVKNKLISMARERFNSQLDKVFIEIDNKIEEAMAKIKNSVANGIEGLIEIETEPLLKAIERYNSKKHKWTSYQIINFKEEIKKVSAPHAA